ncbi:MAG: hypothetical protein M1818_007400 [Claussenomyces sp. TS43310]|nr:MAG: hypothetical protein M1818_007400 [Claussenomyces sp. TS43310]
MEDRIKRMESAITTSGLHGTTEPVEDKEEEKSSSEKLESQAGLSNHLSNLVIDPNGSPSFIGWASGFSLFSPQGLRWISEKVGDKDELAQLVRTVSKHKYGGWGRADADLWYPMPRSQHSPLPSKDLALQYVNSFFITFNNVFPVLNQDVFKSYFERQYSPSPPVGTAWYALLNAVLCLGSIRTKGEREKQIRGSCLIDYTSTAQETGVEYFRNASCCFHDLFFKEANLMAMQAMTLMLFITTSSPNPQTAYVMTSAAGNLANTLGLHRGVNGLSLAREEIEQRRNVFWVFYLMEKAISHNLGRPSVINDDEIAVDLPPKKPGFILSPSRAKVYDVFQDQIKLAIIVSRICSELYSASSQTKSGVDRMKVRDKLDNHLQRWRDAMPVDIRPEHPIKCSDEQYVPVVMMHFTYLDAVILLHRPSSHQESFKDGVATDQRTRLNPRVYASQLLCLAAARRSIQLLDTFSNNNLQNQHLMWLALYYPLSASLALFANILSNPQDKHAASDIHLMNLITSFITHSVQPGTSFAATPTLSAFKELYGIATRLVTNVHPQPSQNLKRSHESDDPAQADFISSSRVRPVLDGSLCADLTTQTTTTFAPYDSSTKFSETDLFASMPSPADSGQKISQGDQDVQSTTSAKRSLDLIDNSPLEFAPFTCPEQSQFDYNPTTYDFLLSPTRTEWDMANMWMPSFASDPPASADLMGSPADASIDFGDASIDFGDASIDFGEDFFNENTDVNDAYQR